MITTKYNPQQVVKEVTAAVAASQGSQQQRHNDSDSEDDEEFGAASTYANYQPAKCMCICDVYMCIYVTYLYYWRFLQCSSDCKTPSV